MNISTKTILLSTSDRVGGAAIACRRLHKAFLMNDIESMMLVQTKSSNDATIIETANSYLKKKQALLRFITEKLIFLYYEKSAKVRFAFSLANRGINFLNVNRLRESDIIHLHWVFQGFISLKSLQQLGSLKKPLVWTLHDMWLFTGGCHYSGNCENYLNHCGHCPFLKRPGINDISNTILVKKREILSNIDLTIVTCSNWLKNKASQSSLLKNHRIEAIPNPIDIDKYKPFDTKATRKEIGLPLNKLLLGFVSFKVDDERKGFYYLNEGLKHFKQNHRGVDKEIEVVIIGRIKGEIPKDFPFRIHNAGTIQDEGKIIKYYNALDVFLCPSLEDNLPNTIMEALACGVPSLTFNIGGISDMIEHKKNGYLAIEKSIEDLSEGLRWILADTGRYQELSQNARAKVVNNFTNEIVANRYLKLYQDILSKK